MSDATVGTDRNEIDIRSVGSGVDAAPPSDRTSTNPLVHNTPTTPRESSRAAGGEEFVSGARRGGTILEPSNPSSVNNGYASGGGEHEFTASGAGGIGNPFSEMIEGGSNSNPHRRRFFEQDHPRGYFYPNNPTRERLSYALHYIKTKFPAVIVAALMVLPTIIGFGYLFGSIFTSVPRETGIPSSGYSSNPKKPRPDWLNVMNKQYYRLASDAVGLLRRIRILFGIGLVSFGVSTALVVFLIEATMNNEISTIAHTLSFVSPIIIFQAVSMFLVRQAALTQKELAPLRGEMNDIQTMMSSGLAASISETAFGEFVENISRNSAKGNEDNEDGASGAPSSQDLRTLASLLSAASRFSS